MQVKSTNFEKKYGFILKPSFLNDRVKIQLDLFHAQKLYPGTITDLIKILLDKKLLGHVQASQVPDRGGINSEGELNFNYIFNLLDKYGYDGFVGLEHN